MKNYLLTVSYCGAAYSGWQTQKNAVTVQQTLEDALAKLTGREISVTASGRTDEGVHALGQVVSFSCDASVPAEKFAAALNTFLPPDIRAVNCREVPEGFCARRSAKRKTYVYRMYLSDRELPHVDGFALRLESPLDTELLQKACKLVEGTHDFVAFRCVGSSAVTTVRTVYSCSIARYPAAGIMPETYELTVCGNGFLYKTVRLVTGALLALNCGKITLADFASALGGNENAIRKVPAPSKGLTLLKVEY